MAKRKPSEIEIEYIINHFNLGVDELSEKMPEVNKKEISVLISNIKNQNIVKTPPINNPDDFTVGNLMQKREGIVVMTPQSAELADARRTLRVNSDPKFNQTHSDKIHVINPNKKK